jgi:hypothetical protein
LHIIETYFGLFSTKKATVRQVDHLQNTLKLRIAEIDALFLGIEEIGPGVYREFMITCEAKRIGEEIIPEQLVAQVKSVFTLENVPKTSVVPIGLRSVAASRIQVVEFNEVSAADAGTIESLAVVNHAVFDILPPVEGIGVR